MLRSAVDGWTHSIWMWTALAYFIAAIPMGVLMGRLRGVNIREVGSGNIGATNAARALGPKLGVVVLVLDVAKAGLPVFLASQDNALGPHAHGGLALVAFAAVLGHIFPVYLGFRGGKGVACALGVFVVLDPPVALGALVMYAQGVVLTRTSAIGSLTSVTAMTVCMLIADKPWPYQLLAAGIAAVIWGRHISNIKGLMHEAKERKRARSTGTQG